MNVPDTLSSIEPMSVGRDFDSPATPAVVGDGAGAVSDTSLFAQSLDRVSAAQALPDEQAVTRAVLEPLGVLDREAVELGEFARSALDSGDELSPGEIVALTVKSQEFMFHSQLTANVANRTADGLQQLFRQQG